MIDQNVLFVKDQIAHYETLKQRFRPDHVRYDRRKIDKYQYAIDGNRRLLELLEGMSAKPIVTETVSAGHDLRDLPPELLKELSDTAKTGDIDPLVNVIKERGGVATLDEILIDSYRKLGEINKRTILANRLYRISKRGQIWIAPGRKGVYSTAPFPENGPRSSPPVVTLFDHKAPQQRA